MAANSDTVIDAYSVLGIKNTVTDREIRRAYLKLAFKFHPDRNKGFETEAEVQFKRIAQAYEKICDPAKRAEYDALNSSSSSSSSSPSVPTPSFSSSFQESNFKFRDGVNLANVTLLSDEDGASIKSGFLNACHEHRSGTSGMGLDFFTLAISNLNFRVFDTASQLRFQALRRSHIQATEGDNLRNFILFPSNGLELRLLVRELLEKNIKMESSAVIIVTTPENHHSVTAEAEVMNLSENIVNVNFKVPTQLLIGHSSQTIDPDVEKANIGVVGNIMDKLIEVMSNLELVMTAKPLALAAPKQKFFIDNKKDDEKKSGPASSCTIS